MWSVPAPRMAEELGGANMANVVMLGFLTAVTDIISIDAIKKSVLASVPTNTRELNLKALEHGYSYGLEKKKAGKKPG